jgi:Mrp family chromosome partitioning ATPase
VTLADALVPIDVTRDGGALLMPSQLATASGEPAGSLEILPAGQLPPDAGDFVVSDAVADILAQLGETADLIVIDAPPFLQAGDAIAIAARVDGVVVVTRLGGRRPTLDELSLTLEQSMADKLGVIVTGDQFERHYYGGYYSSKPASRRHSSAHRLVDNPAQGRRNS